MIIITYALMVILTLTQTYGSSSKAGAEDDIREAVLRYMFQHSATQQHPNAEAFFIAIEEGKDPSDPFMKRFEGNQPLVKKLSQSTYSNDGTGVVIDKVTGGGGVRYSVGSVKWPSNNEARLEGSYYVAMLFAGGCEYRVVLEKGKWIVKGCIGGHWES